MGCYNGDFFRRSSRRHWNEIRVIIRFVNHWDSARYIQCDWRCPVYWLRCWWTWLQYASQTPVCHLSVAKKRHVKKTVRFECCFSVLMAYESTFTGAINLWPPIHVSYIIIYLMEVVNEYIPIHITRRGTTLYGWWFIELDFIVLWGTTYFFDVQATSPMFGVQLVHCK